MAIGLAQRCCAWLVCIAAGVAAAAPAATGPSGKAVDAPFPSNQPAYVPSISADGRYVAYTAFGTNIAENDTNGVADVFVADRATGVQVRVSVATGGAQANEDSRAASISADGNLVAFESSAGNLVGGDTNGARDVFVRNLAAGTTVRASTSAAGAQGGGDSRTPSISASGRYVAFASDAGLLGAGAPGETLVKDLQSGALLRAAPAGVVPNDRGADFPQVSDDGRYVAFSSRASNLVPGDGNGREDVFVYELATGSVVRVSAAAGAEGNGDSVNPSISGDGRYVVFQSAASNLVAGDGNGVEDVFRWDRTNGSLQRLSVGAAGQEATARSYKPWVSRDGAFVSFYSRAALVGDDGNGDDDVYLLGAGNLRLITRFEGGVPTGIAEFYDATLGRAVIANGGTRVAFNAWRSYAEGDNRGWGQVYAFDAATARVQLVSAARTGQAGDGISNQGALSGNGSLVAFSSQATNIVATGDSAIGPDIYLRDVRAGSSSLLSRFAGGSATNDAYNASISDDGSQVAFQSVTGGIDPFDGVFKVYVRNLANGQVQLASKTSAGGAPNEQCVGPSQSANGRYVAFQCPATNMVAGDTNGALDVFVRDLTTQTTTRVSVSSAGTQGNGPSSEPGLSADGRFVVFTSDATNFAGDTNNTSDIYVRDLATGATSRVSVGPGGVEPNAYSTTSMAGAGFWGGRRVISDDGRYVVFVSAATNLVPGVPPSRVNNVFVADRQTGQVELASRGPGAGNHDGGIREPAISGDGRFVVFASNATNLVAGDTNQSYDVFLFDRSNRQLTRVSITSGGGQSNGSSLAPMISSDGSTILFRSDASNLVAGDDNATTDIFLVDRATLSIVRASPRFDAPRSNDSSKRAPSTSADGRYTTLLGSDDEGGPGAAPKGGSANQANFPQFYDWLQDKIERLDGVPGGSAANGSATSTSVSSDGTVATFTSTATNIPPNDASGKPNVYVRTLASPQIFRASANASGEIANGPSGRSAVAQAGDGPRVAFESSASNLVGSDQNGFQDIYVSSGSGASRTLLRASGDCGSGAQANGPSSDPAISASGRYVAFASTASNLVANDGNGSSDVFLCDLQQRTTRRVSANATGASGKAAVVEAGGLPVVAFESDAGNLVPNDGNGVSDVFVANADGTITLASRGLDARAGNAASQNPAISPDGRYVAFVSSATNLVANDDNFQPDVFVFDRNTGTVSRVNTAANGGESDDVSLQPSLAQPNGQTQAIWDSAAFNIVGQQNTGIFDVFRKPIDGSGGPRRIGEGGTGVAIQDGHAGLWYDPTTVGQGWVVSMSRPPAARITVAWYTYEPAPGMKPIWLFGSTDLVTADNTAVVDMIAVEGTSFPPAFDASAVTRRPWGQLLMRFSDCDHAAFSWSSTIQGYAAGTARPVRLTGTDGVPCVPGAAATIAANDAVKASKAVAVAPQSGHAGLWFNPAASGQGWVLSVAPPPAARYTITWYTFEPAPSRHPVWMIGSTSGPDANNALQFNLITLDGTSFMPQFVAGQLVQRPWGALRVEFSSCDAGTFSWTPTAAGYPAGSMPVTRLTSSAGVPCVP